MPPPLRVLIVEDNALLAAVTSRLLQELGCETLGPAPSVAAALELAGSTPPDIALIDVALPDGSGVEVAEQLWNRGVTCAMLTAHLPPKNPTGVLARIEWIDKFDTLDAVRRIVGQAQLQRSQQ